ncbi:MAG: hypothetical protein ACTSVZ_12095 [Promethearchaeota archaeon]
MKNKKKNISNKLKPSEETQKKGKYPSKLIRFDKEISKDKEDQYSDYDLSCDDISPEQCEELRVRKFTNNPEDIFLEVRTLEEQYKYAIKKVQIEEHQKISELERKLTERYQKARINKEKEIARDIHDMESEIEKSLHDLEMHENMILSQIDMVYDLNKPQLIEDALELLGLNFLCTDKEEVNLQ